MGAQPAIVFLGFGRTPLQEKSCPNFFMLNMLLEVIQMIARNYDPSDLRTTTIEKLFYRQIRDITMKTAGVNDKMRTFDLQFSDSWL